MVKTAEIITKHVLSNFEQLLTHHAANNILFLIETILHHIKF